MSTAIALNGIDATTGKYLTPVLTPAQLADRALGLPERLSELNQDAIAQRRRTAKKLGVTDAVDPTDLAEAGWGVIFSSSAEAALIESLRALLDHRKGQARGRYFEFCGEMGFRAGDNKNTFLARHKVGPGVVDPTKVPYYLLIVGDPQSIPFEFQFQLDVGYAVGRLYFDALDGYSQYARNVIAAESAASPRPSSITLFGVRNPGDAATQLSSDHLVAPLTKSLSAHPATLIPPEQCTKAALRSLLGGPQMPALLFTASHGVGFPNGDERQNQNQGALLCQDWPGPLQHVGLVPPEHCFAAADVADDINLTGTMTFHFACYGAGTPRHDHFMRDRQSGKPLEIAPAPFIGRLPQRMLSLPNGSLACIGHIERAWGYSFMWQRAGEQIGVFTATIERLLSGKPVGHAMEYFNYRYAELAVDLSEEIQSVQFGKVRNDELLAGLWTANNDARNYVIIGDPATRLKVQ